MLLGNDFALDDISFAALSIKRDSVIIHVENPIVKTNNDTAACSGLQVQLNTTGASVYTWSPPTGLSDPSIANPIATPSATTEYIVTGTTVNGCTEKDTVNIIVYPKPVITKSKDTTICRNTTVQLFAGGGINYNWSPPATLDDPNIPDPVAAPVNNITYYILVTDANTCNNTDSVKVSIHPDPLFTISPPSKTCENIPVQLAAGGGNIYSWQPAASLDDPSIPNPVAHPSTTTIYTVQITETACNNSTSLSTTLTVSPLPAVKATKSNDIDCSNDHSQLNASGASNYSWTPALSLNNSGISNPVAMPAITTQYIVKGTDAQGCVNYDSVTVEITGDNASGYYMPNAFTPDNDGLNDCYGIRYWGIITDLEFSIYNRWGERIFFTKDPRACWDGKYKGVAQDIGVYVYMIKAKTLCGTTFKKGLFTLIR